MNGNDTMESLTAAYLEGRLSPEEAERLLETIERDEQARRTLFEMKNLYDLGRMNPLDQRQIEAGWERLVRQTSIRSGENRTAGRTSDRTPLRRMARTALRYAAVALIALSAGFAMSRYVVLHRAAGYNEVAAEAKNHSEVVLSDGTRVTLNASSRLRYPTSFDGSVREVWLDGEAYFDVEHDAEHPFIVHSCRQSVRVLGTTFNVQAYSNESENTVTLLSGAVGLDLLDREGELLRSLELHPYEQCHFDKRAGSYRLSELDAYERQVPWDDGVYRFRDQSLAQIAARLQNYYGVRILLIDEAAEKIRYTGSFSLTERLDEVFGVLNHDGRLHIERDGNTYRIRLR
mgnify:CR=1 FL=1